jgi:hypothetical protein
MAMPMRQGSAQHLPFWLRDLLLIDALTARCSKARTGRRVTGRVAKRLTMKKLIPACPRSRTLLALFPMRTTAGHRSQPWEPDAERPEAGIGPVESLPDVHK